MNPFAPEYSVIFEPICSGISNTATDKLAPISIESAERTPHSPAMDIQPCGATLLFPNGLRAHFGSGTENLLRELLDKSLEGHVQP